KYPMRWSAFDQTFHEGHRSHTSCGRVSDAAACAGRTKIADDNASDKANTPATQKRIRGPNLRPGTRHRPRLADLNNYRTTLNLDKPPQEAGSGNTSPQRTDAPDRHRRRHHHVAPKNPIRTREPGRTTRSSGAAPGLATLYIERHQTPAVNRSSQTSHVILHTSSAVLTSCSVTTSRTVPSASTTTPTKNRHPAGRGTARPAPQTRWPACGARSNPAVIPAATAWNALRRRGPYAMRGADWLWSRT
ncbi:MAG: hypothetical protein QOI26_2477, partial [Pseudonocardiales bacterium]|nr:hypothetical protein [Pseudonocardiales bacterium]